MVDTVDTVDTADRADTVATGVRCREGDAPVRQEPVEHPDQQVPLFSFLTGSIVKDPTWNSMFQDNQD